MAEANEMSVYKLAPIVRMKRDDPPRIPAQAGLQGSNGIHLCVRPDRPCFSPSCGTVGDRQDPVEVVHDPSSVMTHQVHGQGTRDIQERVHTGLNGSPAT